MESYFLQWRVNAPFRAHPTEMSTEKILNTWEDDEEIRSFFQVEFLWLSNEMSCDAC